MAQYFVVISLYILMVTLYTYNLDLTRSLLVVGIIHAFSFSDYNKQEFSDSVFMLDNSLFLTRSDYSLCGHLCQQNFYNTHMSTEE